MPKYPRTTINHSSTPVGLSTTMDESNEQYEPHIPPIPYEPYIQPTNIPPLQTLKYLIDTTTTCTHPTSFPQIHLSKIPGLVPYTTTSLTDLRLGCRYAHSLLIPLNSRLNVLRARVNEVRSLFNKPVLGWKAAQTRGFERWVEGADAAELLEGMVGFVVEREEKDAEIAGLVGELYGLLNRAAMQGDGVAFPVVAV
ncbi:hypothetical protein LTR37_016568 [Vermiconidia calcicola]|uniref:Uncharacterized protein n=1 Tax=Vermiconidia calcicola TaxID=1690605 RepID=A0ACC3MP26_9PEZI|nr:hypothetical protein LTR37_016568 [Vermiconidia calcicola]